SGEEAAPQLAGSSLPGHRWVKQPKRKASRAVKSTMDPPHLLDGPVDGDADAAQPALEDGSGTAPVKKRKKRELNSLLQNEVADVPEGRQKRAAATAAAASMAAHRSTKSPSSGRQQAASAKASLASPSSAAVEGNGSDPAHIADVPPPVQSPGQSGH
ncbi:hypothetical protein HaLaN_27011, partial [Haematococcus lacustris]